MALSKKAILSAALVLAAAGVGGFYALRNSGDHPGVVKVSGNIEVTDAEVSFKVPGRVRERRVDEGMRIQAGGVVAVLDSEDLQAQRDARQAALDLAKAAEEELLRSLPEQIAAAEAGMLRAKAAWQDAEAGYLPEEQKAATSARQQAQAEYDRAERDFGRSAALFDKGVITKEEFERVRTAMDVAKERLAQAVEHERLVSQPFREFRRLEAKHAYEQAQAQYRAVYDTRAERLAQAAARRKEAAAALALAQIQLDDATLKAPFGGVVLSKNIEPGEYVVPGTPVVTIGDLDHVWLRAYIDEQKLGLVTYGQKVRVKTDTFPDKVYQGWVAFISSEAEFTPKTVETPRERVKRVYRIKINVDKRENPDMELLPGMPAEAEIELQ